MYSVRLLRKNISHIRGLGLFTSKSVRGLVLGLSSFRHSITGGHFRLLSINRLEKNVFFPPIDRRQEKLLTAISRSEKGEKTPYGILTPQEKVFLIVEVCVLKETLETKMLPVSKQIFSFPLSKIGRGLENVTKETLILNGIRYLTDNI